MKVTQYSNGGESDVLAAMILSADVLGQIAPKWTKEGLFDSPWSNIVGTWCIEFWTKYGAPPKKDVVKIFARWQRGKDEDTVAAVEKFLKQIDGRYDRLAKELNAQFVLDQAKRLFNRVLVRRAIQEAEAELESGREDAALTKLNRADRIEVGASAMVDFFHDAGHSDAAISEKRESVVKYPGAAGEFFGDALERDGFVAILAPMKRAKTFWMLDMAWRAVLQRRRTVFFEIGDLSKNQILKRFNIRASMRPLRATGDKPVRWPLSISKGEEAGDTTVEFDERFFTEDLTPERATANRLRVMKTKVKSDQPYFYVSTHPNSSITVAGIRAELDQLTKRGWIPDVVVVDYADILKPPPGYAESRDAVNANWKELRRLSQELHCLVVTATQANAASFKADRLEMSHFAEDNRKFAHVTGMFGINQTPREKALQVQRLNWLVLREDEFVSTNEVFVAGCLALASPCVVSTF